MEYVDIFVPEKEKTDEWIKQLIEYYNSISYDNNNSRNIDRMCWMYYNNEFNKSRFDYFLKVGNYDLPALPRHIPLQKHMLDVLLSQQTKRPFVYSISCTDKKSIYEKRDQIYKGIMRDLTNIVRKNIVQHNISLQQIEQKMGEMQQMLQQEPQDEQQAMQQQQLRQMMPQLAGQVEMIKGAINDNLSDMTEEFEKIKRYYTYDFKDIKEDIAMKRMTYLYKDLRIKNQSKSAFLHKLVTGKSLYYVDVLPGNVKPVFRAIDSSMVVFPQIEGIDRIQDGPWVKIVSLMSYQQIVEMYGDKIEKKYGKEALKQLAAAYVTSNGGFASSPKGEIDTYGLSPYSGTNQNAQGIRTEWVYVKVPRRVRIKSSPNKYKEGDYFTHFLTSGKSALDENEYNYDARNKKYVNKENPKIEYKKDDVEVYNSRKGEQIETWYTNDIYMGVVINNEYYIDLQKKPNVYRHPDRHGDVKLPVFGPTYSGNTEKPYSLIWTTKDLQDLYDVVHTQRELMIALAGTKTIFFDKSQKPSDISENEFFYEMKKGVAWVETITPDGQPKRTTFNQWSMVDMSVSASIQYLEAILQSLENIMGKIIGVPPQRVGQVVSTDQVGTYNESLNRAMLVTEILYYDHDQIESEALTHLLNLDLAFCASKGDIFEIIDVDFGKEIIEMLPDLFDESYMDILVGDHSEMIKKMGELREAAMIGLKSGNLMFEQMLEIIQADTLIDLKKKVEYFTKQAQQIQQQAAERKHQQDLELEQAKVKFAQEYDSYWRQQEMKIQQMKLQMDAQVKQAELALKERDQKLKEITQQINTNLKQLELINEKASEDNAVMLNDKHSTIDEQIRTLQLQIQTMLNIMQIDKDDRDAIRGHREALEKISVDREKARKMVREHVSDK